MQGAEARVAAVKERAEEMARQIQIRRSRIIGVSSVVACLIVIIALSFAMPDMVADMPEKETAYWGAAASLFDESSAYGYVFIGLLAFVFGVGVTILGYRIHLKNRKDRADMGGSDG